MAQLDERANPTGQLRRAAGGSSTGRSTGAALIGTEDPLAGLNAATPGVDLDEDGELTATTQSDGDSSNPSDPPVFVREAANRGGWLSLLVVVVAFIWGLSEVV